MALRIEKMLALCAAMIVTSLPLAIVGCGSEATLPPAQADAVSKLEAAKANVVKRDGKVTSVDFYAMPDAASAVVHLESLPDVQKLNFSSTNIGDAELAHLANLSELTELGLTNTKVTDQGLAHLAGLKKLTKLTLNGCNVTDAGLMHLQNLKQLKHLHLNGTKVSDAGLKHLAGLEQLEWLLAYGTSVTSSGAVALREKQPATQVVTTEGESDAGAELDKE